MTKINLWKIAFGVALIFILYLKLCSGNIQPQVDVVNKNDSLVRKANTDSIERDAEFKAFSNLLDSVIKEKKAAENKLNLSEILLYQSQGKINSLVKQLAVAKSLPFDSSFVYISPKYITVCDSLGIVATQQGEQLNEARRDKDMLIDLMNYETQLRDSMLNAERENYNTLKADFNAQTHFFQLAVKQNKPRAKVYAGISALGNNEHPFGGGEVSAMLVNKKDQAFELGAGFMGENWYARAGVKFKIKF